MPASPGSGNRRNREEGEPVPLLISFPALCRYAWAMQKENQLFEDFARLLSSLAGTMAGAGREAEERMRERLRAFVGGADAVSREEHDALRELAAETRSELERLKQEVADLRAAMESRTRKTAG